jgi:uncharacterized protein YggT (Ycf19 family)
VDIVYGVANTFLTIISLAILVRALLSWFYPNMGRDPFTRLLVNVTEPLLAPIRGLLSRLLPIPIDFSPIVVLLLIRFLQEMLFRAYIGL